MGLKPHIHVWHWKILGLSSKNGLTFTYAWHCRCGEVRNKVPWWSWRIDMGEDF